MKAALGIIVGLSLVFAATGCSSTEYDFDVNPVPTAGSSAVEEEAEARIAAFEDCMIAAGWPPIETDSGKGYKFEDSQRTVFMEANSSCLDSSGLNEPIGPAPDVKQSYQSMVNMHACLELAGFEVEDPPSFQSFSDDNARWTPYETIPIGEMTDAEAVCPQNGF